MKLLCALPALTLFCATTLAQAMPDSFISDGSYISQAEPFEVGVNMHLDGMPGVARVRDLGATWVRIDVNWDGVEPSPGHWDFSAPDRSVRDAKSQGLKIFATLAYAPAWARKSPDNSGVPDPEAWKNFVRAAARHYCGEVDVYGIWNEPNLEEFWTGSAKEYAEILLKPAYPIIHQESPGSLVAGPELAHLYSARLGVQAFFDTLKNLDCGEYLDILSHHIYGDEDYAQKVTGYRVAGLVYRQGLLQMLMRSQLFGKPVWITEMGVASHPSDEITQAQRLTEQLELLRSQPWIKKAFIYQLGDYGGEGPKWGLLRPDSTLKPAYFSVQSLIHYEIQPGD